MSERYVPARALLGHGRPVPLRRARSPGERAHRFASSSAARTTRPGKPTTRAALGSARDVGEGTIPEGGRGAAPLVGAGVRDAGRTRPDRAGPGRCENVYVITGDSGMGMTHGTLGARLVADLIHGRTNPWPRSTRRRGGCRGRLRRSRESPNMAAQYADWLTGGDVNRRRTFRRGKGRWSATG